MAEIQHGDSFTSDLTMLSAFKLGMQFFTSCGKTKQAKMHPFLIEIDDLFSLLRLTETLLQPPKEKNLGSATKGKTIINQPLLLATLNPHGILYTIRCAVRHTGILPCCKKTLYTVKMSFTF